MEWISILDGLPDVDVEVLVTQDKGYYSELDEDGEPNYWFTSEYFWAKQWSTWIKRTRTAALWYICDEGYPIWLKPHTPKQGYYEIDYITHWKPMPEPA